MSLKTDDHTQASSERLGFRVEGMDCASCVGKIETALERMAGISEVSVNFAAETLALTRIEGAKTSARDIEKKIRALGFDVERLPDFAASTSAPHLDASHGRGGSDDNHAHNHGGHDHSGCDGHHEHGDQGHAQKHSHDHSGCDGHHERGDQSHTVASDQAQKHSHDHGECGGDHNHVHAAGSPEHHDHHACGGHEEKGGHGGHDHSHEHGACGGDHPHDNSHGSCATPVQVGSRAASPPSAPPNLSMRVEGMDCASCIGKIETALGRMAGLSDVRINFTTETLELTLAPDTTTRVADVERTIKNLGFGVSDVQQRDSGTPASVSAPPTSTRVQRWWQTKKGKLVVGLGALMGAAYAVAQFFPTHAEWIFAAAVVAGVVPFARKAFALAISGSPFSIEMLMSVAAIGALVIGEAEEAAAVVFLFAVGELLESVAAGRARAGIKALASLVPKTAVLLNASGGQKTVPASELRVNDRVLVRPGDRVPADGVIDHGSSSLDESPITGESVPRVKSGGEQVFAGSINVDGVLQVRVEKVASDNTIARIIHLVEQAQSSKAPTARFIEKFSRIYTPAVMAIAALIVVGPPLLMGADWFTWLYRGLALLLIACPCALVLSTPAAIASGLAVATRRGLLIKGGNALETIGKVRAIAFDKTGTLTQGKPLVTDIVAYGPGGEDGVLVLAAAVETGSNHPLAKAIVERAHADELSVPKATDASATAGKAVHATVHGRKLAVGSPTHAEQVAKLSTAQRKTIEQLEDGGKTVAVLFDEQEKAVLGLLALRDEPRRDARAAVAQLRELGVRSVMLTGDNRRTAKAIAGDLGIDWKAELLPQDKLRIVNEIKRDAKVAMVGDGINDAPALATADVGIAMGGGTDVALETADAALLKSRVTDVAHLIALSRATMSNIHQNVVFALGLKGLFLVTTVFGVTGLWVAVMADTGATALVTLNALRLLRFGKQKTADSDGDGGVSARRLSVAT
ncbi:heavy metal translocating P-type ATPase [Cupriavidus metallidurans]|uniref:P-type Zn(2+) transporter n=1 Tax=Cupriavidus metallidurans TaxID=119219 RepID=A0A482IYA9_9BURK|nr:heavy metal translocating P-type ATPase [Cupriavidus metallidurans]QBP12543.1 cadmium-translocating P-type ATPase [Cupriavidus metallidurans]